MPDDAPDMRPRLTLTRRGRVLAVAAALVGAVLVLSLDATSGGEIGAETDADNADNATGSVRTPATDGPTETDPPTLAPFGAPDGPPHESETAVTADDSPPPAVVNGRTQPPRVEVRPSSTGRLVVVAGSTAPVTGPTGWTYRVEVEEGLAFDGAEFAAAVHATLSDPRGWGTDGHVFQRLDTDDVDFRLILATPALTDQLCAPLVTSGRVSCRNGDLVVLNALRWADGVEDYGADVASYREYLVNHEVGHRLGRRHVPCPGAGQPAPVMMQQTYGVGECTPNAWPLTGE